jgi:hypothetical protein
MLLVLVTLYQIYIDIIDYSNVRFKDSSICFGLLIQISVDVLWIEAPLRGPFFLNFELLNLNLELNYSDLCRLANDAANRLK